MENYTLDRGKKTETDLSPSPYLLHRPPTTSKKDLTLPSNVDNFFRFSNFPTKQLSQREPLNSEMDTNFHSIPMSNFQAKQGHPKARVQSAHPRKQSSSVSCKHSGNQFGFANTTSENYNKTIRARRGSYQKPRLGLARRSVGKMYIRHITSEKKKSQGSSSHLPEQQSCKGNAGNYLMMGFEDKKFMEKISISRKNSRQIRGEESPVKKSFFTKISQKHKENDDPFNLVGELDKERRALYNQIMTKSAGSLNSSGKLKILKQYLKTKKKNILSLIRENMNLEKKWKNLNIQYEQKQQEKVSQYEYMKGLVLKDVSGLSTLEKSIVLKINNVSKSQIQKEISQILAHKTEFVKVDQKELSESKTYRSQTQSNLEVSQSFQGPIPGVPRLYSD